MTERTWATLGKVGLVISLLVGILKIIQITYPDKPQIETVFRKEVILLPFFDPTDVKLDDSQDTKGLTGEPGHEIQERFFKELLSSIAALGKKFLTDRDIEVLSINMRNDGSRKASDIKLTLYEDNSKALVFFRIYREGTWSPVRASINVLSVGSLLPDDEIRIQVWHVTDRHRDYLEPRPRFYHSDSIKISHADGIERVLEPVLVGSFSEWWTYATERVFPWWSQPLALLGALVFLLGLFSTVGLVMAISSDRKDKNAEDKKEKESTDLRKKDDPDAPENSQA